MGRNGRRIPSGGPGWLQELQYIELLQDPPPRKPDEEGRFLVQTYVRASCPNPPWRMAGPGKPWQVELYLHDWDIGPDKPARDYVARLLVTLLDHGAVQISFQGDVFRLQDPEKKIKLFEDARAICEQERPEQPLDIQPWNGEAPSVTLTLRGTAASRAVPPTSALQVPAPEEPAGPNPGDLSPKPEPASKPEAPRQPEDFPPQALPAPPPEGLPKPEEPPLPPEPPKEEWSLVEGRYVLGEPSGSFYQRPFPAKQMGRNLHRTDLAADAAQIGELLIFGASMRGAMHYSSGSMRQDSFAIGSQTDPLGRQWAIAAVADGVSEAVRSHQLADYMVRQAAVQAEGLLSGFRADRLEALDWEGLSAGLVEASQEFCRRMSQGKMPPGQWSSLWATTLEFAVIRADGPWPRPCAHISVAGDGAAYLLEGRERWQAVKSGKSRQGAIASNAVKALPGDPGAPVLSFGPLERGQRLFLTTDGLSDMIGTGGTALERFLLEKLPGCKSLIAFLRVMDVSMYQADDDRTGILIGEYGT